MEINNDFEEKQFDNRKVIDEEPEMIILENYKQDYQYDPEEGNRIIDSYTTYVEEDGIKVGYIYFDKDFNMTNDKSKALYYRRTTYIDGKESIEGGELGKKL